jgi:hypothetical protein
MAPKFVEIADLRTGLPVEFLGDPEPFDVDGEALRKRGMRLLPGHPGRIFRPAPEHVQANWVGLEEEPASYGRGFNVESNEATTYYELGVISENEFERRQQALRAALDSERDLSDWTPPWVDGT